MNNALVRYDACLGTEGRCFRHYEYSLWYTEVKCAESDSRHVGTAVIRCCAFRRAKVFE